MTLSVVGIWISVGRYGLTVNAILPFSETSAPSYQIKETKRYSIDINVEG